MPTAAAAAVARAFRLGVVLSRPDALEPLSRARVYAFDKTGTLTLGRPEVVDAKPIEGPLEEALYYAASLEADSGHPIARAIVDYYKRLTGGEPGRPSEADEVPGRGVLGVVDGRSVAVGGSKLLEDLGIPEPTVDVGGLTRVYVVVDGRVSAALGLEDPPRPEAREALQWIEGLGGEAVILSGDNPEAVARLAARLGLPPVAARGGLDPVEKADAVASLKKQGPVVYVGDGVNDGPALAEADAGIAVSEALDAAKQAGDAVLAKSDLRAIPALALLARRALRTIRLNLFWAFAYNATLIPIAAGALEPLGVHLNPTLAALAMSLSSITVTANSALLLRWRPRQPRVHTQA